MSIFKAISNFFSSKAATPEQPLTEQELANALVKREVEASRARFEAKRLAVEADNKEALKKIEGQAEAKELARQLTATFEQMKQMDKAKKKAEKRLAEADKAWDKQIESNYDLITKLREDYANSLLDLDEEEEEYQAPKPARVVATQPIQVPATVVSKPSASEPVQLAPVAPVAPAPEGLVIQERGQKTDVEVNPNKIPPVYHG